MYIFTYFSAYILASLYNEGLCFPTNPNFNPIDETTHCVAMQSAIVKLGPSLYDFGL